MVEDTILKPWGNDIYLIDLPVIFHSIPVMSSGSLHSEVSIFLYPHDANHWNPPFSESTPGSKLTETDQPGDRAGKTTRFH